MFETGKSLSAILKFDSVLEKNQPIYKRYIVYTDASDNACGAQLTQEHDGTEFPIAFLSLTFLETQRKWSTTEQEAYGVYYTVTKWNYYLQGADIIVQNDYKPLAKFLNIKNANNKVNRWQLELATYNIAFEWISGAKNKAYYCLSHLVELPPTSSASINMLSVSNTDGPAFNTRSQTQHNCATDTPTVQPSITPDIMPTLDPTPKSLTADTLQVLLQMQKTDPFCKCISKWFSNKKAPKHETELFTHIRGLQYKHITDSGQMFLALVMPKSWKYTVLVEAHDKLGHQGDTHTYYLIKHQYYWKGLSTSNGGDPQQTIWQNCNRPSYWMWNFSTWKQAYPYHYWPLNRMTRGIPYTRQICRHHSINFNQ